jgi:hypothetical protein
VRYPCDRLEAGYCACLLPNLPPTHAHALSRAHTNRDGETGRRGDEAGTKGATSQHRHTQHGPRYDQARAPVGECHENHAPPCNRRADTPHFRQFTPYCLQGSSRRQRPSLAQPPGSETGTRRKNTPPDMTDTSEVSFRRIALHSAAPPCVHASVDMLDAKTCSEEPCCEHFGNDLFLCEHRCEHMGNASRLFQKFSAVYRRGRQRN